MTTKTTDWEKGEHVGGYSVIIDVRTPAEWEVLIRPLDVARQRTQCMQSTQMNKIYRICHHEKHNILHKMILQVLTIDCCVYLFVFVCVCVCVCTCLGMCARVCIACRVCVCLCV